VLATTPDGLHQYIEREPTSHLRAHGRAGSAATEEIQADCQVRSAFAGADANQDIKVKAG